MTMHARRRVAADRADRLQLGLALEVAEAELSVAVAPARVERAVQRADGRLSAHVGEQHERVMPAARDALGPHTVSSPRIEGHALEKALVGLVPEAQLARAVESTGEQAARLCEQAEAQGEVRLREYGASRRA